jgi:hypothetical protein
MREVPSGVRSALELVKAALGRGDPILNYIVTGSGHEPYDLQPTQRPQIFEGDTPFHKVASAAFYNSAATVELVSALEELDPDAIIIVKAADQDVAGFGLVEGASDASDVFERRRTYVRAIVLFIHVSASSKLRNR